MPLVSCIVDTDGTGDYSSLNAAVAANFGATSADLATNDEWVECDCQCTSGSADTTAVTIDGLTTAVGNDVKIWCDPDGDYRHEGVWDNTKYRLEGTASLFYLEIYHTTLDGLQLSQNNDSSSSRFAVRIGPGSGGVSDININACIIKIVDAGANTRNVINIASTGDSGSEINITNSLLYCEDGVCGNGVNHYYDGDVTVNIYNCVCYGLEQGLYTDSNPINAINCAVFGNDDDFVGTFDEIDHCASDDGDGTNSVTPTDWDTVFEDYANGDFRLLSTDTDLIDAGTDLSDDMDSVDIAGTSRPSGEWDIGAFEYEQTSGTTWNIGGVSGVTNVSGVDSPTEIGGVS